jgi:hypothetical protein
MAPEHLREEATSERDEALAECDNQIAFLRGQASRNKRLMYLATLTIMLSSSAIPLTLLVSTQVGGFVVGKLIPAVLAAAAALAAGSTQLLRPHDRWRTYRHEQRLLEADRIAYVHRVGEYTSGTQAPDDRARDRKPSHHARQVA